MKRLPAAMLMLLVLVCRVSASAHLARQSTTEPVGQRTALDEMVLAERRFAARALVVGWKQAFLEYFADNAIGFDGDQASPAKDLFRKLPDPPKDRKLIWEPRYGDIALSGDLGYLTGPVRRVVPGQNNGQAFHSIYASVWQRQSDGSFKVVMDAGVPTPRPVAFAEGFTRAFRPDVYIGTTTPVAARKSLKDTDAALTNAARSGQADAYRSHMVNGVRFHRADRMPVIGERAALEWLRGEPPYASGESRFAETSTSGDLGYTYGTYALQGTVEARGFYVRVWTRGRDGVWKVVLDVFQ